MVDKTKKVIVETASAYNFPSYLVLDYYDWLDTHGDHSVVMNLQLKHNIGIFGRLKIILKYLLGSGDNMVWADIDITDLESQIQIRDFLNYSIKNTRKVLEKNNVK